MLNMKKVVAPLRAILVDNARGLWKFVAVFSVFRLLTHHESGFIGDMLAMRQPGGVVP